MNKQPLVILTGPTAVGKTKLSVQLAKKINGSIISADSMQVYRYMDIGSAKITPQEMQGIPHYLIDEFLPEDEFNIVIFQKKAKEYMQQIYAQGRIPILTGGTGFYIQSVVKDIDFSKEEENTVLRQQLEAIAEEKGCLYLHEELKKVDAVSAEKIHPNNVKRVIRALEYYEQNKQPISAHNAAEKEKSSPYNFAYFVLNDVRSHLYARIEKRIDLMLQQGLVDEVQALKDRGCHTGMVSMQGLGYKEILAYLNGEISYEEAVYILKRDTRHFAKRQLTWFRREEEVLWIDKDAFAYEEEKILEYMLHCLEEKNII